VGVPAAEGRRTSPEFVVRRPKWGAGGAFGSGKDDASNGGSGAAGLGRNRRRRAAEAAGWFGRETTRRLRAYREGQGGARRAEHEGLGPVTIWSPEGRRRRVQAAARSGASAVAS